MSMRALAALSIKCLARSPIFREGARRDVQDVNMVVDRFEVVQRLDAAQLRAICPSHCHGNLINQRKVIAGADIGPAVVVIYKAQPADRET
jgi:hypothetical protein